jgi:hypothetical protein
MLGGLAMRPVRVPVRRAVGELLEVERDAGCRGYYRVLAVHEGGDRGIVTCSGARGPFDVFLPPDPEITVWRAEPAPLGRMV